MMRAMRASAKWIMLFIALAFVGWMVFDVGMDLTGRGGASLGDAVASVNGVKIDLQTYYAALRQAQEQQRQQMGTAPVTLEGQRALENAVLENLIQEVLLSQEYRRRGIRVTDAEIVEAARTSPPPEVRQVPEFQTDGEFDLAKYQRYIASNADPGFLVALEARYRDEIPRIKLFQQLTSDVYVTNTELWNRYRDQNDSVTISLVRLSPSEVAADSQLTVTDDDVQRYYREHREEFRRPAVAYTSYVSIPRAPNAADSAAALARAREIKAELDDGADFAALARRESADSSSAPQGGDLGEVPRGRFVPEFEAAALALRPGRTSSPVLSPFGYHIIRLESSTDTTFHARHILIPVELAGDHLDEVEGRADTLDLYVAEQADPTLLDEWAAKIGLAVNTAPPIIDGNRPFLQGDAVPDAGIWAFEARPGDMSPVIEAPSAFYVFRLDSLRPEGVPPLADVRAVARRSALEAKQWDRTRELAERLAAELRSGQPLMQMALENLLPANTMGPMTRARPAPELQDVPEVVGAAFGLGVGEASGPIETTRGIFFVEPVSKQLADSSEFVVQLTSLRFQALQGAQQNRLRRFLLSLRNEAQVVDRRRELERLQRDLAEQDFPAPFSPVGF